jgi:hypothetical protein
VLWLGAILTTGRRTITNICRTVRPYAQSHVSSYHRVFSQRRWRDSRMLPVEAIVGIYAEGWHT